MEEGSHNNLKDAEEDDDDDSDCRGNVTTTSLSMVAHIFAPARPRVIRDSSVRRTAECHASPSFSVGFTSP